MAKHVYTRKEVCKEMKKEADSLLVPVRLERLAADPQSNIKLLEEQCSDTLRREANAIIGFIDKLKAKT